MPSARRRFELPALLTLLLCTQTQTAAAEGSPSRPREQRLLQALTPAQEASDYGSATPSGGEEAGQAFIAATNAAVTAYFGAQDSDSPADVEEGAAIAKQAATMLLDTSKAGTAAYSAGLATQQAAGNASLAAQALSEGSADAAMQYVEDSKKAAAQAGIFAGQVPQG